MPKAGAAQTSRAGAGHHISLTAPVQVLTAMTVGVSDAAVIPADALGG